MAKIKQGSVAASFMGTVGGVTFSRVATCQVARGWRAGVNKRTQRQRQNRQLLARWSAAWWSEVTAAQRTGWETYAQTVTFYNIHGDPYTISGMQMYLRTALVAAHWSGGVSNVAPTIAGLPTSRTLTLDLTHATGVLRVTAMAPAGLAADRLWFGSMNFDRVTRNRPRGRIDYGVDAPGNFAIPFNINTYTAPMPGAAGDWYGWTKFWYYDSDNRMTNAQFINVVSS